MGQPVTVVVPCRNEADALPVVLAAIPPEYSVIVVDNGSTDATAEVATAWGARVVHEPQPGYGAAVLAGIATVTTPLTAVIDGDGSLDPKELAQLIAAVEAGADLAVGRRRSRLSEAGVWPWHARLGSSVAAWRLRRKHGVDVHDIAPMRVARTDRLQGLNVQDRRFGFPIELLVRAGAANWRISEHDISYRRRAGGVSKVSGSVRGSFVATVDFLRMLR
ncbi:glycosyltransferase family 2 protein [Smaragdicoccus niigatensis]|uniref:glycosyltransferase family 2 protein n=1 Tax=Smaragdicoccus niigatensis TaxID=359359 RepID=UPI000382AEB5|nr:glycosyltransferase family 2 protein [Smaragdicoccus niigatensis]